MTERFVSIRGISICMSEEDYTEASRLMDLAAVLLCDETQTNPEYTRGVAEMVMIIMGWSCDEVPGVIEVIRARAKQPTHNSKENPNE
jgi:hypothetical protein